MIKYLSPEDAVKQTDAVIIDIRDITELKQTGMIKDAIHIPLFLFQTKASPSSPEFHGSLDTSKTTLIYCASGARANMACNFLLSHGFQDVYNIGGLMHWQGEVVPYD